MKQTLKTTAAIIGIVAAGALFNIAIDTPITDRATEAVTALTALVAVAAAIYLAGYAIKAITSKQ